MFFDLGFGDFTDLWTCALWSLKFPQDVRLEPTYSWVREATGSVVFNGQTGHLVLVVVHSCGVFFLSRSASVTSAGPVIENRSDWHPPSSMQRDTSKPLQQILMAFQREALDPGSPWRIIQGLCLLTNYRQAMRNFLEGNSASSRFCAFT